VGALMGYFGGWVDMLLYRVVEVFMAIPLLFLLIVAAAVLPRNTYVMMAIIGCVTWTGSARFIRAEFYKLRGQDFVQSARAVGLPLRSVLFKHMLPNGVTPVLVDASFAIAAAITGGDLTITGCNPGHLGALIQKLWQTGVHVEELGPDRMRASATGTLRAQDMSTEEYPGFATDLQAQYMALMTQAEGISIIRETIFENRFMHVLELVRMGASIRIDGRQAIVAGSRKLTGAPVIASDLRASASLLLAAMAAEGETVIDRVYHLDRGYERIEEKLIGVGARIERITE